MRRAKPIVVVALNPAMDVEWRVRRVLPEEKNDVLAQRRWPGGKGVNVARWLRHLGAPVRLVILVGGSTGAELLHDLHREGLATCPILVEGDTRNNIIVTAEAGGQWRFNHRGPSCDPGVLRQIRAAVESEARVGRLVVFSGSLAPGLPSGTYRDLIRTVHRTGAVPVLDCDGAAFALAVPARPALVKPNEHELGLWAREPLDSKEALMKAACRLARRTRGSVLLSRGARGAWLIGAAPDQAWFAAAPRFGAVLNSVGAGDAALAAAAWRMAADEDLTNQLAWAVAAGSCYVTQRAGSFPSKATIRRTAEALDLRPLQE